MALGVSYKLKRAGARHGISDTLKCFDYSSPLHVGFELVPLNNFGNPLFIADPHEMLKCNKFHPF